MNDATSQRDTDPAHARAGHEPTEIGVRPILVFAAALAALTIVALVLIALMMRGFSADEKADGTTTRQLVEEKAGDFPAPRLQRNTTYDLKEFRKQEADALNSYGWVDPKAGIAQIPIATAMDLVAKKAVPKRKPPARPANAPASEPGKKD
jgi:hypothetical protein